MSGARSFCKEEEEEEEEDVYDEGKIKREEDRGNKYGFLQAPNFFKKKEAKDEQERCQQQQQQHRSRRINTFEHNTNDY